MTALSLMDWPSIARDSNFGRIMRPAAFGFLRPRAIAPKLPRPACGERCTKRPRSSRYRAPSGPALTEAGTVEHRRIAAVDRQIPRSLEDRARLQAVEAADRMAEMGRIGVADVLCQMRQIDVFVDEMQQMPRPLPGAEGAKRHAGLFLEQMQEPRRRQIDRRSAIGRGHLGAGKITEFCGSAFDPRIDVAVRQMLAETQLVEIP